ncbi:MAG: PAS domain S-box protein [Flavisolibacter sp.]
MLTNCNLLLQSISESVFMLDKDGYIKYANSAASDLTGYTSDEFLNKPLSVLYEQSREARIKTDYELTLVLKSKKLITEGWKYKKDGSKFWGESTLSPIYSEAGIHEGFSFLLRDVSERKQLELATRQSEQQFRLMVESVKDYAIFLLGPKGHIKTWNEGARLLKGYSADDIIGKHFSTFYTREDLDTKKPERELEIAIRTGKYEEEGWRVKKNGSVFWAGVVITALFNEQNQHIGFSKVTRDLTVRKENEEQLKQSEERYRSLVEQVIDYGIFMLDEKGRIISWNEGAHNIKGWRADEVIGKYFSIFYTEEDLINDKPGYELRVAKAEGKFEEEGWRMRKDGSKFWANVVITAVYNTHNNLIGFSKVTRDLTERKESEKALKESYDSFRRLAEELKLTNAELTYANQELEQFTSIVSHDLQEPIRTIKSFLQLIDMKLGPNQEEDLKSYIGKAINAGNRMRELIQNLLHYSQLGKDEIVTDNVNVTDLFNEVLQNLKSTIESHKAQIIIENEIGIIKGDRVQLVQLIQNIISNSLKFTEHGKPKIRVRARMENNEPHFSITDNGIGIAEGDQTKIFEIFRRLNTGNAYPGTGIGLAICKKIVERHRGRIWPESEPGKGTTFHFTINAENGIQQKA